VGAVSTSESWGVNSTPRNVLAPYPRSGILGVWLEATETSAAPWALQMRMSLRYGLRLRIAVYCYIFGN